MPVFVLAALESLLCGSAAWGALKLYKGSPNEPVDRASRAAAGRNRKAGAAILAVTMIAAFVVPFAANFPHMLWWTSPLVVAVIVLTGLRRRRLLRRGSVSFAAWMLLTASLVELAFFLFESR
jgi:hypothetical protein